MIHGCRFGRFYKRCGAPSIAVCQYCGRPYCTAHGDWGSSENEVCAREICRRKHADLAVHLRFRDRAHMRNRHGLCGIEQCMAERWGQCSKCEGLFCEAHLTNRGESVRSGMSSFSRPASFCEHCLRRRKLWSKR